VYGLTRWLDRRVRLLSGVQRQQVVEVVIQAAARRVPVIAGVAATATADAVAQARSYEAMGADGILAILEAYFPLSDAQIESYFKAIAEAVKLPVVLYTNPNFQRADLSLPVSRDWRKCRISLRSRMPDQHRLAVIINQRIAAVFAASAHSTAVMLIGGRLDGRPGMHRAPPERRPHDLCRARNGPRRCSAKEAVGIARRSPIQSFTRIKGTDHAGYDVSDPVPPQAAIGEGAPTRRASGRSGHCNALTQS
jgi:4-hydroxy-tetrahydrodipicolinate synthase